MTIQDDIALPAKQAKRKRHKENLMGVYEGRGQLTKAMKVLVHRWNEAKGSWEDAVSKEFEARHVASLELDLRNAVGAMDHMAILLQQIRRDCGE